MLYSPSLSVVYKFKFSEDPGSSLDRSVNLSIVFVFFAHIVHVSGESPFNHFHSRKIYLKIERCIWSTLYSSMMSFKYITPKLEYMDRNALSICFVVVRFNHFIFFSLFLVIYPSTIFNWPFYYMLWNPGT